MALPTTRPPRAAPDAAPLVTDPDIVMTLLEDASHMPGGHAAGVVFARSEADVAAVLQSGEAVLPVGARSSVTGGGTPMGETVLATTRMDRILAIDHGRVRLEPGVTIGALQAALAGHGQIYPPAPTYPGACIGGTVATNAAGAATFKHGSTRGWIEALTVVLPGGEVLDVARGEHRAGPEGFTLATSRGPVRVPVPGYAMPAVPKRSAGYHAEPGMDLIDLFIGSEGTLGVITDVTLRTLEAPASSLALVECPTRACALDLVAALCAEARATWRSRDPRGLDVAAVEQMDRRSIEILREDGADDRHAVRIAADTDTLLIVQIDLPPGTRAEDAYEQIGAAGDAAADGPLVRLCRLLEARGLLDRTEIAAPGDAHRIAQFVALREAVPAGVNHRVALAQAAIDARITKSAGDMIVPLVRFAEMLALYDERFRRRGLDYAVWGHASDGHVHPNVIPRSYADVEAGREALLELGRDVARLGGCPLAEHGVGRNAIKQALLRQMYGDEGLEAMRAVKRAIDPRWTLSPGVIFQRTGM